MLTSGNFPVPHRYVFIGGLHRSGTSLTARLFAALPGVAAIENAPVPENEGVYLQGAIPHDALSGRPMHFATDPAQHLTETHPLNRLETRTRLESDWAPWFAPAPWRVEKSPVNLTRMRLLQQLFPLAQFVVVIRHPEAVAAAVAKWVDAPPAALIDHWLSAHDRLIGDLERIHAVMVLRYEDITASPETFQKALATFLSIPATGVGIAETIADRNDEYAGSRQLDREQSDRAARWGYGPGLSVDRNWASTVQHPLRSVRDNTANLTTTRAQNSLPDGP